MGFTDNEGKPGNFAEQYNSRREHHLSSLQQKEEEMRQKFVIRVKEKEAELKEAEKEVIKVDIILTETGAYPQLPTQPSFFLLFSNLYSNLIWSFWVASQRKIKIWIRGKKVQCITEKVGLWAFLARKRNFQ